MIKRNNWGFNELRSSGIQVVDRNNNSQIGGIIFAAVILIFVFWIFGATCMKTEQGVKMYEQHLNRQIMIEQLPERMKPERSVM